MTPFVVQVVSSPGPSNGHNGDDPSISHVADGVATGRLTKAYTTNHRRGLIPAARRTRWLSLP